MEPILFEWGSLLLRWTHVVAGIAWIGASFHFMHLDASLRAAPEIPVGTGAEAWQVHGGGFYQMRKYLVAPAQLPAELTWHKWQSYATWLTGFFLLLWVYYAQASLFLIDPAVRELNLPAALTFGLGGLALGWLVYDQLCKSRVARFELALAAVGFFLVVGMAAFFQTIFSPRGAFIHTGALMASIMTGNVFFVIIPNQKKVVASLLAGQTPDPALGAAAKQRSAHNNYLTLPVLFLMLSNHYPLTYSSPYAYVIVGLILIAGALVRVFYNERHAGHGDKLWCWFIAFACVFAALWISMASSPGGRDILGLPRAPVSQQGGRSPPAEIAGIVERRCVMCHAAEPAWDGIGVAPRGVRLDSGENIARFASLILMQTAVHAMPPNNITEMTSAERAQLAQWARGEQRPRD